MPNAQRSLISTGALFVTQGSNVEKQASIAKPKLTDFSAKHKLHSRSLIQE